MKLGSGAQEKTRTSTTVRPLAPEASASTNSATWARGRIVAISVHSNLVKLGDVGALARAGRIALSAAGRRASFARLATLLQGDAKGRSNGVPHRISRASR